MSSKKKERKADASVQVADNGRIEGTGFEIESGIMIPPRRATYPFERLEHGQSVVLLKKARSALAQLLRRKVDLRGQFVTRSIDSDHVRVWRIIEGREHSAQ